MGFTLIELSIVLVIIGLIIGGILVGRDMVRAAELRSILTDVDRYNTAVNTFRIKYNCLPGDCLNATDFFGTDSHCPPGDGVSGTCNGNGNGLIEWDVPGGYHDEAFRAWQQLNIAELVGGNLSGVSVNLQAQIGINIPASRISGVGYLIFYTNTAGDSNPARNLLDTDFTHRILVGRDVADYPNFAAFASPKEAYGLDSKIDDGNPFSGRMTVLSDGYNSDRMPIGSCAYVSGSYAKDTYYNNGAGSDKLVCDMVFRLGI